MAKIKLYTISTLLLFFIGCNSAKEKPIKNHNSSTKAPNISTSLIVLGTVQDAGSPQIGCKKDCCKNLFENPDESRKVVSLGVVDHEYKTKYIFEATPDFVAQVDQLISLGFQNNRSVPDGIFLTHAHIGHYTGLMYLGKEAMNADKALVQAMPKMKGFLENNGPWSQLVNNQNIVLETLKEDSIITLTSNISVLPFTVPHRDEYSETVGYKIFGPNKKVLFIPDIDKWEKWDRKIEDEIASVDYAFVDATFFDGEEINNRDISTIPHPFIIESMQRFEQLPDREKDKIYFIHFNHTNPALNTESKQAKLILQNGFHIAKRGDILEL